MAENTVYILRIWLKGEEWHDSHSIHVIDDIVELRDHRDRYSSYSDKKPT